MEKKMFALFKRKFKAATHTVVASEPISTGAVRILRPPENAPLVRWVKIGTTVYGVTPRDCYEGILASGKPYYPYYDHDLTTVDPPEYDDNSRRKLLRSNP